MKKKISIIIPVYNGENHIEKCINKLLRQNLTNLEIIIINDGSKDKTKQILEKYSNEKVISVINKENTGVSDTRNIGIRKSTGEYIMFLDSDDSLCDGAIDIINSKIKKISYDMLLFGFNVSGCGNRKNDTDILTQLMKTKIDKKVIMEHILKNKNNIYGYAWRAVYRKSVLVKNDIKFVEKLKISEDYLFLISSVNVADKICVIDKELYCYQLGDSSMSIKYIPSLLEDMLYANFEIKKNIIDDNKNFYKYFNNNMGNTYLRFVQNEVRKKRSYKDTLKKIYFEKKQYKFETCLLSCIFQKRDFNFKTYVSILMFSLYLEFLYVFLFMLHERK